MRKEKGSNSSSDQNLHYPLVAPITPGITVQAMLSSSSLQPIPSTHFRPLSIKINHISMNRDKIILLSSKSSKKQQINLL
jgi:hypothetical protein